MPLPPGTRLGPYEITGSLGAGGMGEVYRARDTRLDRAVAVKVLPQLFADDATLRARFDREARAISALNHPHICTLHDVGLEGTTAYLVMECVDGQPLTGPLPIAQAIPIALQICDGLEAAHRAGIVHRDLKPSNILVSKTGASRAHVKLLDFGLATRVEAAQASSVERATMSALTGAHTIIGTPQYMAPEQIEGREADTRTDIFALGCILYELLTGKPAFEGRSPSSVMAAVLATNPRSVRELVPITPPMLDWIVTRCLAKDPDDRWQTVRDLRAALDRVLHEPQTAAIAPPRRSRAGIAVAVAAAIVAIAASAVALRLWLRPEAPDTRVLMSEFTPPTSPVGAPVFRLALSPDGQRLAYTAPADKGVVMLWIRSLDSLSAHPLPGTAGASGPFWSPDSRSIAFWADGKLKRTDAVGGPVTTICNAVLAPPGSWNKDGVIVFTGADQALARVAASGGSPERLLSVAEQTGERIQMAPYFLPDGDHFIYASGLSGSRVRRILIGSIASRTSAVLLDAVTSNALYANGHLLFLRERTLMAQRFDTAKLAVSGEPVAIAEEVAINPVTGTGAFTASQTGIIAFQSSDQGAGFQLTWFDRTGRNLGQLGGRSAFFDVDLSPDGRHASATLPREGTQFTDVWVYDIARRLPTRFTFDRESSSGAVWSSDGTSLIYSVGHEAGSVLMKKAASGAGDAEKLFEDPQNSLVPLSWSPDGRYLLYQISAGARTGKLAVLPLTGDRKPYRLFGSEFSEIPAEFSPDGRWVAYVSTQASGVKQVYVTTFPKPTGVWQISTDGGDFPRWRANGKEIFYLTSDRLMSASVSINGDRFEVGEVKPLFTVSWPFATRAVYDVTPDGQRFLTNVADAGSTARPITLISNWPAKVQ
jgi:serine/threonine protein kinase/Tol biopolymer transport system component